MSAALFCLALLTAPPALVEDFGNLDGAWRFRTDPGEVGEREGWQQPAHRDEDWRELTVPGLWEPQGVTDPRPGQAPKVDPKLRWTDYDGTAWYRRRVTVPAAWAGQELALNLGAVDDVDRTFFNGQLVGATGPGVDRASTVARSYRVAPELVKPGVENVIAVRVTDHGGPGGWPGPTVSLVTKAYLEKPMTVPGDDRPFAERFANPPGSCRILKIVHGFPDDPAAQDAQRQSLLRQGFGGVVGNVSFTNYVSDEGKWQAFVRASREAHQAGMALWLYDEKGYPSGNAGGLVLAEHPEWECLGLLVTTADTTGTAVDLTLPPGTPRLIRAYRLQDGQPVAAGSLDLAGQVREGKLAWQPPADAWRVLAMTEHRLYEGTHAEANLHAHIPYINLLQAEPTKRFIELTHQRYLDHLGPEGLKWFTATFTDEPSLMSLYFRRQPHAPLPWAPDFAAEFQRRRGYDLLPLLPALAVDLPGASKVRFDFWTTVGDLVSERFCGQIRDWCRAHGIASGGHLLAEESVLGHVALYGDFFRCLRTLDAPSIDCLTSLPPQVPWHIAKYVGSAADLNGNTFTMCETSDHSQRYRREGDTRPVQVVTEAEIRGTCSKLILGGVNTITSYYSFSGLTGQQLRQLNAEVGRLATTLRGGHQVTDLAVVYPVESIQAHYVPAAQGATQQPAATQVGATFNAVHGALYAARRDFTFIDSPTLAGATVADDSLVSGRLRWRGVVLPAVDTLPWAAWEKLAAFVRAGGLVIAVGNLPANDEQDFPAARVQALATELFGPGSDPRTKVHPSGGVGIFLPPGADGLLPVVLDAAIEPDVAVRQAASSLRVAHRRVDGREVYHLFNDSPDPLRETVVLAVTGAGERLDPATGAITTAASGQDLAVDLPAYGSVLFRFASDRPRQRRTLATGGLPGLDLSPLPVVTPVVRQGEFVTGRSEPDPDRPGMVKCVGRLTKSGVDTWLFAAHAYAQPVDLSQAGYLVLDVASPATQRTGANVVVFVTEQGGGDFLASTGRTLSAGGRTRVYLSLARLALYGGSSNKDADGKLDLSRIAEIRVGWGGYFGVEGETIEFSLGPLASARPGR